MKCYKLLPILITMASFGQVAPSANNSDRKYVEPGTVKINLSEDGSSYLRFITWAQIWTTVTDNNKGSLGANGNLLKAPTLDIGIRRARVAAIAQFSSRFLLVLHFGANNQSFNSKREPQIYFHDAYTEYAVVKNALHIGTGLHYWNGVSRLASSSTTNTATLDSPILNWPNVNTTDQFVRQLGIYAKGQIGRLDYRVSINKPFAFGLKEDNLEGFKKSVVTINGQKEVMATYVMNENIAYAGYFKWMFLDKESNMLPYEVGTYLGKKRVFNVGAGFYLHPKTFASLSSVEGKSLNFYDQYNLGFDVYWDTPLANNSAVSLYSVYYINHFGKNYVRNIGILNTSVDVQKGTDNSASGSGNMQPTLGTGNIWYNHFGYKLPPLKNGSAFMPYASYTLKNFEGIGSISNQFDLGLNFFITGHNAKITAQYSLRPTYVYDTVQNWKPDGLKGEFTIQTQVMF